MLDIIIEEKEQIQKNITESSGYDVKKQVEDNQRIALELAKKYNISLHYMDAISPVTENI